MELIQATLADLDSFSEIEFENMSKILPPNSDWDLEFVKKVVRENIHRSWKLTDDGILGFYYWSPDKDCAVLLSMQVAGHHQSKGYGAKLFEHFQAEAKRQGFTKLGLAAHTHNRAYQWYLRNGFRYVEDDGPGCHVMMKEI